MWGDPQRRVELKTSGYLNLEYETDGIVTIVGTSSVTFSDLLAYAPSGKCYLSGSLVNMTPQTFRLKIMTEGFEDVVYEIPGFGGLQFKKHPMTSMRVAVNGTVRLKGVGFIVDFETQADENGLLNAESIIVIPDYGRTNIYPNNDHTDISSATTATCATPETGKTIRVFKITVSSQGASRPIIITTDSDGTSNSKTIGTLNFASEGTFVYDFADGGYSIPNGVGGLIRITSNNTAVLDVDIISRDD